MHYDWTGTIFRMDQALSQMRFIIRLDSIKNESSVIMLFSLSISQVQ